jgi:pimeloyl-ACP methyl ester carboxylesterase
MIQSIRLNELTVLHAAPSGPARRPVLFIHGYFADASIWTKWLERFAAHGLDAYAVSLRGRAGSRSDAKLGAVSMRDFADDAASVARAIDAAVVVGHSMGGLIAQQLAERGEIDAAVLLAPAPPRGISVLSPRLALKQLKHMPAILLSRPVYPGREDLREMVMNRVPTHEQDALLDRMLPDSGRAARDVSLTGVPVDPSRVRCPLLVFAAEDDRFIPAHIVQRVAARYGAPLVMAEHHGHMLIVEPEWEAIADQVETWIRTHT